MIHKGWLHPDGSVRQTEAGSIGEVMFKETRYNLRRVHVTREWRVYLPSHASGNWVGGTDRRGPVLDVALRSHFKDDRSIRP